MLFIKENDLLNMTPSEGRAVCLGHRRWALEVLVEGVWKTIGDDHGFRRHFFKIECIRAYGRRHGIDAIEVHASPLNSLQRA